MSDKISYIGYEMTGSRPVTDFFVRESVPFEIIEDGAVERLFDSRPGILSRERDAVRIGKFLREGKELHFAEFAILIHDGLLSHLSFLFDHPPVLEDLEGCADDMEGIVLKTLKKLHDQKGGLA